MVDGFEPTKPPALPDRRLLALLSGVLRPHRSAVVALLLVGLFGSLFEGVGLGLFVPFLHSMESDSAQMAEGGWLGRTLGGPFAHLPPSRRLVVIALLIFTCVLLKGVLNYANSLLFTGLGARIGHRLRQGIFDQVLTVDYRFLNASGSARFLNALHTESWRVTQAISTFLQALITLGSLGIYVALLLLLSPMLTLVVAGLAALIMAIMHFLMRDVGRIGTEMTRANADIARRMVDGVDGIDVIRAFGREDYERSRFVDASLALNRLLVRLGRLSGAVYPIYEVLAAAILVGVLLTSLGAGADLPPLLVFVFLMYRLEPKAKELDRARLDLISLETSVRETLELIDRENKNYIASGSRPFTGVRQSLRFEHVGFTYGDSGAALEDVSVEIPARSMLALVGPSGAGKSTFAKLLLRFYDPTEGRILVDGVPFTELDLRAWRERASVVSQKVYLFSATVRDNISYGRLGATEEEVIKAAREAGAHDFIVKLPEGYRTRLGAGGVQLSGGEEQRIALARAIVREPEILILDEATNALDSISERLVQRALEALRQRCTMVVIAHRLSTIERADQIVVLEDGRIIEQGSLEELIARDGLFARLYRLQTSQVDPA